MLTCCGQVTEISGSIVEGDTSKQLIITFVTGKRLAFEFQNEHDALLFRQAYLALQPPLQIGCNRSMPRLVHYRHSATGGTAEIVAQAAGPPRVNVWSWCRNLLEEVRSGTYTTIMYASPLMTSLSPSSPQELSPECHQMEDDMH